MKERVEASLQLAESSKTKDSIEEQLYWIEQPEKNTISLGSVSTTSNAQNDAEKSELESWVKTKSVTEQEVEQNHAKRKDNNEPSKYYNRDFLEEYGIQKGSKDENRFSQYFFNRESLSDCIGLSFRVADTSYLLKRYEATKAGHTTFYVFIRTDA